MKDEFDGYFDCVKKGRKTTTRRQLYAYSGEREALVSFKNSLDAWIYLRKTEDSKPNKYGHISEFVLKRGDNTHISKVYFPFEARIGYGDFYKTNDLIVVKLSWNSDRVEIFIFNGEKKRYRHYVHGFIKGRFNKQIEEARKNNPRLFTLFKQPTLSELVATCPELFCNNKVK